MKLAVAAVVALAALAAGPASSTVPGPGCVDNGIPIGSGLVPTGAAPVNLWTVPAAGGVPRQVVVEWAKGGYPPRHGVGIWQCGPREAFRHGFLMVWHRLYSRLWGDLFLRVAIGDLTLDGHAEVLFELDQGSGGVGPRVVLDTSHGRARPIFRRTTHDTSFEIRSHALIVAAGVYTWHDAHCCSTFSRRTVWRWKGGVLKPVASALYADCNPSACAKEPLHFVPKASVFWDAERGVAIGARTHPWLLGRTGDGGKTWRIVDASPVPLFGLERTAPGRATARFAGCGSRCVVPVASTADYGANWSPQWGWPLIQVSPG